MPVAMRRLVIHKTPNLDKIAEVKERSQAIGEFLDWLRTDKRIILAEWSSLETELYEVGTPNERLLAEFFGVDLDGAERERRKILGTLQHNYRIEQAEKSQAKQLQPAAGGSTINALADTERS